MSKTLYISAGHSNSDPGAVNAKLNLREADLTRGLRNLVVEKLTWMGATVRSDGTGTQNNERNTAIEEAAKCDGLKLDIHFNAGVEAAQGVEAFSDASEKALAQKLAKAVADVLGSPLRGDAGWKGRTESQHGSRGLAWLDRLPRSLLLEVCFISNPREIQTYLAKMDAVAQAIADILFKHNQ
ncbi:MAG: N-acetylmuramoyl-L-alanine amidase [Ignavibacteria bacterium]|nr:N-acetylmuramoyl-L-alanine amidase [Ignavibacteria bacterium]MBL7990396.1 N-acetylmuramoyl-L-alanine amidase [Candidatus Kapabacteria bacterium]